MESNYDVGGYKSHHSSYFINQAIKTTSFMASFPYVSYRDVVVMMVSVRRTRLKLIIHGAVFFISMRNESF